MKHAPYIGPTNIWRRSTKFSCPGNLEPGICSPLAQGTSWA